MIGKFGKRGFILLFSFILGIGLLWGGYSFYITPMKNSLKLKENQLKTDQQIVTTLQNQIQVSETNTDIASVAMLQQKLPVKPLADQLILDIEKAEIISNSFVSRMEMVEEAVSDTTLQQERSSATPDSNSSETENEINRNGDSNSVDQVQSDLTIPLSLMRTTVKLQLEAGNYFDLEKFIETLEASRRIIVVNSIDFMGPDEKINLEQDAGEPILYEIVITAYYLPNLIELQKSLPKIDSPEPANKRYPFSAYGEVSEKDLSEETDQ